MKSPIVTFIIPLKSREVSQDWSLVSRLCNQTINSILRQSCPDLKIILVCNQTPEKLTQDSRIEVITDNFPIPMDRREIFLDQKLKIKKGMLACRGFGEGYVMRMDADDFVHRQLVEYIKNHYGANGWYIPKGFVYQEDSDWIYIRNNFHFSTASSHIVWLTESDLPKSMETTDNDYFVDLWQHLRLKNTCEKLQRPLLPLPFRGAAYTIGHSESVMLHSLRNWQSLRKLCWKIISVRRLNSQHREDFGFCCTS
jgi:hypothetical protein